MEIVNGDHLKFIMRLYSLIGCTLLILLNSLLSTNLLNKDDDGILFKWTLLPVQDCEGTVVANGQLYCIKKNKTVNKKINVYQEVFYFQDQGMWCQDNDNNQ